MCSSDESIWHLLFGLQTSQLEYLSLKVKENFKKAQWEDGRTNVKKVIEKKILRRESFNV